MKSALYRGTVRHRRHAPVPHAFRYGLYMLYLDLAELDSVFRGRWLWSARRFAPAWFRRADYLGDPSVPLDAAVRDLAEERSGTRPEGPVRVLTHLRTFGYCFNPVSLYYCFDKDGGEVTHVAAEITNTPWNERHTYVLAGRAARFRKEFHVSPFWDMDHEYRWRLGAPGPRLGVHMENWKDGARVFDATLLLERRPITGGSLARALLRYPFITGRVVAGIYWQALRLRLKGCPSYAHPARRSA